MCPIVICGELRRSKFVSQTRKIFLIRLSSPVTSTTSIFFFWWFHKTSIILKSETKHFSTFGLRFQSLQINDAFICWNESMVQILQKITGISYNKVIKILIIFKHLIGGSSSGKHIHHKNPKVLQDTSKGAVVLIFQKYGE